MSGSAKESVKETFPAVAEISMLETEAAIQAVRSRTYTHRHTTVTHTKKDRNSPAGSKGSPQETLCMRLWARCPTELWTELQSGIGYTQTHRHTLMYAQAQRLEVTFCNSPGLESQTYRPSLSRSSCDWRGWKKKRSPVQRSPSSGSDDWVGSSVGTRLHHPPADTRAETLEAAAGLIHSKVW